MGRSMFGITAALALAIALTAPASAGEKLTMDGSTGMIPLVSELAKAYQRKQPGVEIGLGKGIESIGGIRSTIEGKIDAGLVSRPLKPEEKGAGLKEVEIARVGTVFAAHAENPIAGITEQQACDIYTGKVKNWKEVGGPDLAILPLSRPPQEADPTVIRDKIACFKELREAEGVLVLLKSGDMSNALASRAGTIGMTNTTALGALKGKVKALALGGVAPTQENVGKGTYPLIRRFFIVTKGNPSPTIARFLEFVRSADGAKVVTELNAVPVK